MRQPGAEGLMEVPAASGCFCTTGITVAAAVNIRFLPLYLSKLVSSAAAPFASSHLCYCCKLLLLIRIHRLLVPQT